jgi:hypothetical protein
MPIVMVTFHDFLYEVFLGITPLVKNCHGEFRICCVTFQLPIWRSLCELTMVLQIVGAAIHVLSCKVLYLETGIVLLVKDC